MGGSFLLFGENAYRLPFYSCPMAYTHKKEANQDHGQGGRAMNPTVTQDEELARMRRIKEEIRETLREWENAKRFFEHALGHEQVDYAIHAIITAEKRYAMLIHKAREMKGPWPKWEEIGE